MERVPGGSVNADWRQIARNLAGLVVWAPNDNVWRDYLDGDRHAAYIIDFWRDEVESIGDQWWAAELDAACDDRFNPPSA